VLGSRLGCSAGGWACSAGGRGARLPGARPPAGVLGRRLGARSAAGLHHCWLRCSAAGWAAPLGPMSTRRTAGLSFREVLQLHEGLAAPL